MSILDINSVFDLGKSIIERIWPDANKRAEEMRKLEELRQNGRLEELNAEVKLLLGQLEINKIEAGSDSLFIAGWRPAIGWTAAIALALAYIPKSIMITIIWSIQCISIMVQADNVSLVTLPLFPDLGITDIIGLLMSMLGIGAMRSYDKKNNIDTKKIGD